MAVYKIFPTADASLYSRFPDQNTGLDEILEVSVKNDINGATYLVDPVSGSAFLSDDLRRSIVLFSDSDLAILKSYATGSWKANLKLYLAEAENLNTTYSIEIARVSSSWNMGTGKFADDPATINGACWYNPKYYTTATNGWISSSYFTTPGGGDWVTSSIVTQSFTYKDSKDVNANVTTIVNSWFSGSKNSGFIIKHPNAIENNSGSYVGLNFFSVDTHTIYPPTLEIKWDDSVFTQELNVVTNNLFVLTVDNNTGTYRNTTGKYTFRIKARNKFPARNFTTGSVYLNNLALPQASYWALQDYKTGDMIIDFDYNYTKVSCDNISSYINVYMDGLEPERYYKLLFRAVLATGESVDIDNDIIFKITR
jgi:hypothetical protein